MPDINLRHELWMYARLKVGPIKTCKDVSKHILHAREYTLASMHASMKVFTRSETHKHFYINPFARWGINSNENG